MCHRKDGDLNRCAIHFTTLLLNIVVKVRLAHMGIRARCSSKFQFRVSAVMQTQTITWDNNHSVIRCFFVIGSRHGARPLELAELGCSRHGGLELDRFFSERL